MLIHQDANIEFRNANQLYADKTDQQYLNPTNIILKIYVYICIYIHHTYFRKKVPRWKMILKIFTDEHYVWNVLHKKLAYFCAIPCFPYTWKLSSDISCWHGPIAIPSTMFSTHSTPVGGTDRGHTDTT